jgi:hypothetical protein
LQKLQARSLLTWRIHLLGASSGSNRRDAAPPHTSPRRELAPPPPHASLWRLLTLCEAPKPRPIKEGNPPDPFLRAQDTKRPAQRKLWSFRVLSSRVPSFPTSCGAPAGKRGKARQGRLFLPCREVLDPWRPSYIYIYICMYIYTHGDLSLQCRESRCLVGTTYLSRQERGKLAARGVERQPARERSRRSGVSANV